jgi:Protein of unknown function (DUF2568)
MSVVKALNLTLRFLLELVMLAGLAWTGWHLGGPWPVRLLLAVLLVVVGVVAWGLWVAPRARRRLPDPARLGVEVVLFAVASVGLAATASLPSGIGLAAAYTVNVTLGFVWHQREL